jgi:hypothetical protein
LSTVDCDVTVLLAKWRAGDRQAADVLIGHVHRELRRIAARHMRREQRRSILETSALVNEAWLRLAANRAGDKCISVTSLPDGKCLEAAPVPRRTHKPAREHARRLTVRSAKRHRDQSPESYAGPGSGPVASRTTKFRPLPTLRELLRQAQSKLAAFSYAGHREPPPPKRHRSHNAAQDRAANT